MKSLSRNNKFIFIFFLILISIYISTKSIAKNSSPTEIPEYSYSVNNMCYSGTYVGETSNGLPSGKGRFESADDSPYSFTYLGEFQNGLFDGTGKCFFPDKSYLECNFSSGIPTGEGIIMSPNNSYSTINFNKFGIPYGYSNIYSSNDKLINRDFFINGELLTTLQENAQQIDYRDLYLTPNDYYGTILKIEGTISHVYENESTCIFKIQDQNNNIYWGNYKNTSYSKYNQAIMPTLKKGDILTLYAFSKGLTNYYCTNDADSNNILLPEVSAITAQLKNESINYRNLSYDYKNVLRFPYHYVNEPKTIRGYIKCIVKKYNKSYIKISDSDNNIYYVLPKKKKEIKSLMPGDFISIDGAYNGLYKEYDSTTKKPANLFLLFKATKSINILHEKQ